MPIWICDVCGLSTTENPGFCQGCLHPDTSLELHVRCPGCQSLERLEDGQCTQCGHSLEDDELD